MYKYIIGLGKVIADIKTAAQDGCSFVVHKQKLLKAATWSMIAQLSSLHTMFLELYVMQVISFYSSQLISKVRSDENGIS